jgi:3-oxoacyl-[acyl-carrier-protein] synthase II
MQRRRAVITGLGVLSPLGCDIEKFWQRMIAGQSGIRRTTRIDVSRYASQIAGELVEFNLDQFVTKKEQRRMDPFSHYGIAAAKLAMADSGLNMSVQNPERVGCIVSSGVGGLQVLEEQHTILMTRGPSRFSPFMIPQMISNMASGLIAIDLNLKGPNFCLVSACASATHSIGEALRRIQWGEAEAMFAGGTEAPLCDLGIGGFCALRALSTRNDAPEKASRPFDMDRDGFVIGEGAGVLVVEELEHARKRGAKIYCEISGYGATCDAVHMVAPDETGAGAARGMRIAMEDAGLTPADIDYINAHGTSTELNDKCETMAIKQCLGLDRAKQVMISSTKSMTGHLLGAAGGVESAAVALALQRGVVPPTINYTTPDPNCDLDYVPNTAREVKIRAVLKNSLGFGGHNATLCFKAFA